RGPKTWVKGKWVRLTREEEAIGLLPPGLPRQLGPILSHLLNGIPTLSTGIQINLVCPLRGSPLPNEPDHVARNDDGQGQIDLEKVVGDFARVVRHAADGGRGRGALRPSGLGRAMPCGSEYWKELERVVIVREGDVLAQHDGAPGEEGGEARKGEEPCEHGLGSGGQVDVRYKSSILIQVLKRECSPNGENLGCVSRLGKGGERPRATIHTTQSNTEYRDANSDVDEMVDALDTRTVKDTDERRRLSGSTTEEEVGVVIGNEQADEQEGKNNVFLIADGMVLRGFGVSDAASPTSSVPANENAAVTNTAQTPLNPLANAPGSCQYLPPTYSEYSPLAGPPPHTHTRAMKQNMMTTNSLRQDDQNSSSAYPRVPNTLMRTMARKKMVIQAASGTLLGQYETVIPAAVISRGGIEHSDGEGVESTRKRVQDGHFTDCLARHEDHEANDEPVDDDGGRTSDSERAS
ncbi:14547_t:CDS:2, partial [Acaulospora colombiana]